MDATERMRQALTELIYRNPQRHDGHAYDLDLAAWGLGVNPAKPIPSDFGQAALDVADAEDYINSLGEIYTMLEEGMT